MIKKTMTYIGKLRNGIGKMDMTIEEYIRNRMVELKPTFKDALRKHDIYKLNPSLKTLREMKLASDKLETHLNEINDDVFNEWIKHHSSECDENELLELLRTMYNKFCTD